MSVTVPTSASALTAAFAYRNDFGDAWINVPSVDVDRVRYSLAPQAAEATFSLKYGSVMELGPAGAGQAVIPPANYQGKQVRITITNAAGTSIYWYGYCPRASEDILRTGLNPVNTSQTLYSGDASFSAYGLDYFLKTTTLDRSYVLRGGSMVRLNRVLDFNHTSRGRNGRILGNRSAANLGGIYGFHDSDDDRWTALEAANYLLYAFHEQTGIQFTFAAGSQHLSLDAIEEAWTGLEGASYYDALTRLIRPSRGFTFFVHGTTIKVISITDTAVGSYIPANPNVVSLTMDQSDTMASASISHIENVHYDYIAVRGERLRVVFTMDTGAGTMGAGWTAAEETAYKAAADGDRAGDAHAKVYCRLTLPDAFTGIASGAVVFPQINEATGLPNWASVGTYFLRDMILDRGLPIEDAETEQPRAPLVILRHEGKYLRANNPNDDDLQGCGIRVLDDGIGIQMSPKFPHYFGLNHFAETSDNDPVVDWNEIYATVSAYTDERVRVKIAGLSAESGATERIKFIDVPNAHCWVVASGTVTDFTEAALTVSSAPQTLRDDTAILRRVADLARAWYGRPRAELSVEYGEGILLDRLGHVVKEAYAGGVTTPAGTVVTEIVYDLKSLTTSIKTEWQDIDLGDIMRPVSGLTPAVERRIRAVEDQLAIAPVLVGGGGGGQTAKWAKITVDNANGTYSATEQERSAGAWIDKSGGETWTVLQEQTAFVGVPVNTVVLVWQRAEASAWVFDWPVVLHLESLEGWNTLKDQALIHAAGGNPKWVDLADFECPEEEA